MPKFAFPEALDRKYAHHFQLLINQYSSGRICFVINRFGRCRVSAVCLFVSPAILSSLGVVRLPSWLSVCQSSVTIRQPISRDYPSVSRWQKALLDDLDYACALAA